MKKFKNKATLILSVLALLFTSCNNLMNDDATFSVEKTGKGKVKIYATSSEEYVNFAQYEPSAAKTILPDALDGSALHFYLWGDNKLDVSKNLPVGKKDFYATNGKSGREGTVEIDIGVSQYELYLAAVPNNFTLPADGAEDSKRTAVKNACLLYAKATVDMRYNESVTFYLTPNNISGNADVSLNLKTKWLIEEPYTVAGNIVYGIYNINTNTAIREDSNSLLTANQALDINFSATNVPSGTYNFKIAFIDSRNDNKKYYYSDTMIVLARQNINKEIYIPNVIGEKPEAPTNLTAKYSDPENISSDYYDVQFVWKDNSNNEQNFKLDLLDISNLSGDATTKASQEEKILAIMSYDGATEAKITAANTAWSNLWEDLGLNFQKVYTKDIYSNPADYVAGSLDANSKCVTIRLSLGKRYLARISAQNNAGVSTPAYLILDKEDDDPDFLPVSYKRAGSSTDIVPKRFPKSATSISRFRIRYNLCNGRYIKANYNASGVIQNLEGTLATIENIRTLSGTLTEDVRYYSQLDYTSLDQAPSDFISNYGNYYEKSGSNFVKLTSVKTFAADTYYKKGNEILNPLYVKDAKDASTDVFALASSGNYFAGWKKDSISKETVYKVEHNDAKTVNAKQVLKAVNAENLNNAYTGFDNLELFAIYTSATAFIYNPADYAILESDVLIYKTTDTENGISNSIQVASISEKSNNFTVSNNVTTGYKEVYIAVRDRRISDGQNEEKFNISLEIRPTGNQSYIFGETITKGIRKIEKTVNRYVLTTSQPIDFNDASGYQNYYEKEGNVYKQIEDASQTWQKDKYFYIDDSSLVSNDFTYFTIPVSSSYGNGVYDIKISLSSSKNPTSPLTYHFYMTVQDGVTYSATTVQPLDWATSYTKYYKKSGESFVANDSTTWSTEIYQKN